VVVAGSDTVVEMGSVVSVTVGPVVDTGGRVVDSPSPSPSPHPAANRNSARITVARDLIAGTSECRGYIERGRVAVFG